MTKRLKITQIKSSVGYDRKKRRVLKALGFRRLHQTLIKEDNPAIRGMIRKVGFLLKIEEVEAEK
ncbi:MAG: 50S ribosomal protein L30 [Fidelibacterota bacterium]